MGNVDKILELVKESGLTAKEFAENAGIAGGSITDWKTGRSKPSIDSLKKIATYANVDINWLVGLAYFKSEAEHIELMNQSLDIILGLEKKECYILEADIKFLTSNKTSPDEIIGIIKKYQINNLIDLINFLTHDYEENKKVYKLIYGTDSFSLISFLKQCSFKCDISKKTKIERKIKILDDNQNNYFTSLPQYYSCPVYGQISAGQPNWAEECLEGYLPIDPNLMNIINPEEHFFLRVNGDSMNKVVKDGAFALIHKQEEVENGEIAVVLVNGYEATLKKFSKQNDIVILEPISGDPTYTTQVYDKETEIKILGKYVGKFEMNN